MPHDPPKSRDPRAEKARDLGRQRKIASNNSDKAARKHARAIKAGANRTIRRADKQMLAAELDGVEDSADHLTAAHQRKARHWGTDNAAARRAAQAEKHASYRAVGSRTEVQRQQWQQLRDRIDNEAVTKIINDTLARLKK